MKAFQLNQEKPIRVILIKYCKNMLKHLIFMTHLLQVKLEKL